MKTAEERFFAKVAKTPTCWNWTAAKNKGGYGQFSPATRNTVGAHVFSFILANGPVPDGMMVDHTCHQHECVNPAHLRAATRKQNAEHQIAAHRDSTTGVRGVFLDKRTGRYVAAVTHNRKRYAAGSYLSLEDAEAAAIAKRNELYTHNLADRMVTK